LKQLKANLKELQTVISTRRDVEGRLRRQINAARRVHAKISEQLAPIVDDAYFEVMTAMEKAKRNAGQIIKSDASGGSVNDQAADPISDKVLELRNALEIAALSHLLTNLMSEGAAVRESAALVPIEDRFTAAANSLIKATKAPKPVIPVRKAKLQAHHWRRNGRSRHSLARRCRTRLGRSR